MNQQLKLSTPIITDEELHELIIDAIQDVKGKGIIRLDLRKLDDAPTDYFIICEGDSNTQIKAIADRVQFRLKQEVGVYPNHMEGMKGATWVLLDYFTTVLHVFHRERRGFYELEDLWSDAEFTEYETL